jgi:hypothetical protein
LNLGTEALYKLDVWEDGMTYGVQDSDDDGADELLAGSAHPVWEEYAEIEAGEVSCEKHNDIPSCGICISRSAKVHFCFTDEEVPGVFTPQSFKRSGTSAKTDSRKNDRLIEVHAVSCDVTASMSTRKFCGRVDKLTRETNMRRFQIAPLHVSILRSRHGSL